MHQTIESSIRDPRESIDKDQDGKTVTIDASLPEADKQQSLLGKQQSALSKSQITFDPSYEPDQGASMTFTYKEGLVVQVLPNGNVQQTIISNSKLSKKQSVLVNDTSDVQKESYRTITRQAQVIC